MKALKVNGSVECQCPPGQISLATNCECECIDESSAGDLCICTLAYTLTGCADASYCGTFVRTDHVCDGAPTYQLGGVDGPGLYRVTWTDGTKRWLVNSSARLAGCTVAAGEGLSSCPIGSVTPVQVGTWYDYRASAYGRITVMASDGPCDGLSIDGSGC